MAELGGGYSLGPDPHDLHTTLGVSAGLCPWLDASLVGFYGLLGGGDKYGLFVGLAPKLSLARR